MYEDKCPTCPNLGSYCNCGRSKFLKQTKKQSVLETITNTAVGFAISLAATFFIFPVLNIESTGSKNVAVTIFFTVISLLRGYVIRRIFNK